MGPTIGSIVFLMFMGVCAVSTVSAFAQSNTGRDRDDGQSTHSAVRVYSAAREADADVGPATNVSIPAAFRPLVASMLARSPTFRRQYARLGRSAHLSVVVRCDMPPGWPLPALTQIWARPGGAVEALVHINPSARAIELIAHEFEHIIERLDGVDLRAKARLRASGVKETANKDTFETTRAIVTGQQVAREVLEGAH
jgi:hypothetical protein